MIKKTTVISDTKRILGQLPTIKADVPSFIYIAMGNARCQKADLYVSNGDHVNCCQVIGMRHGAFFDQPIHATVSGTFVGFEKHYHRSGKLVDFIKIENDGLDTLDSSVKSRSEEEIEALSKEDVTNILKDCASVGLGGSSFPSYIKLQTNEKINTILINGVECEPYITSDHRLMLEEPEAIIDGIRILMRAFSCRDARICVKSKYADLRGVYTELLKRYEGEGISLCPVGNYYPQGWELEMIKSALGISIPPGELPSKHGIIDFNVSTVYGIHQNVRMNKPVIERDISISGDGVCFPSNFKVRVGTPIKTLIEKCGGYKNPDIPKTFILGGPMMGASLPSDDCIITKTVTSVIVLNHSSYEEEPCIRCGSCVLSCPADLLPVDIMNAVKAVDKERIKALNPLKCVECGLCTYSCTSKIQVTDYVRRAKIFARLP